MKGISDNSESMPAPDKLYCQNVSNVYGANGLQTTHNPPTTYLNTWAMNMKWY
jgi:hypothetical protein